MATYITQVPGGYTGPVVYVVQRWVIDDDPQTLGVFTDRDNAAATADNADGEITVDSIPLDVAL